MTVSIPCLIFLVSSRHAERQSLLPNLMETFMSFWSDYLQLGFLSFVDPLQISLNGKLLIHLDKLRFQLIIETNFHLLWVHVIQSDLLYGCLYLLVLKRLFQLFYGISQSESFYCLVPDCSSGCSINVNHWWRKK